MPDIGKPNGSALLPDLKNYRYEILNVPRVSAAGGSTVWPTRASTRVIPSAFLVIDAQNNRLVWVSDQAHPTLLGSTPGPPAATGAFPPRDVAVSPLNYNRNFSGAGSHPIIVPVPGVGNVFVLRNRSWKALSSTPFGRPQSVAASCSAVVVGDYHNSVVTIFRFTQPKAAVCEELVNVALAGTRVGSPTVLVKPYGNFKAAVSVGLNLGRASRSRIVTTNTPRASLRAGRIAQVGVRFSAAESAAIAAALRRSGHLNGTVRLRLTNHAGTFTVNRPIRIRRG
jgi:hypothetical protein